MSNRGYSRRFTVGFGVVSGVAGALIWSSCASAPSTPSRSWPSATTPPADAASSVVERSVRAMGTELEIVVEGAGREAALDASETAFVAIQEVEQRLSTWIPDSELSRLNQSRVGKPFSVSPELERELRQVDEIARDTDYAFSPWVGPWVDAWELRSSKKRPTPPSAEARARAARSSRPDAFAWRRSGWVRRRSGARIEEGAWGKGAGLDAAVAALGALGAEGGVRAAILNFGGQLSVFGRARAQAEIASPAKRDQTLAQFELTRGSVSTSSNSEQPGHELDPRTGEPAPFRGSATAVADSGIEADALSTALFVMGPEKGLEWANSRGKTALFVIPLPKGWLIRTSCAWQATLRSVASDTQIETPLSCPNPAFKPNPPATP